MYKANFLTSQSINNLTLKNSIQFDIDTITKTCDI